MIDVLAQAIHDTVHGFKGGAIKLAVLCGMNPGTLNNKAYPDNDQAQLNLRESIPLQRATGNYSILHSYANLLDHAAIPLGDFSDVSDIGLLDLYAGYHAEIGETAVQIRDALSKQRLTHDMTRGVRRELIEDIQAGLAFLSRLEALTDDDDDC